MICYIIDCLNKTIEVFLIQKSTTEGENLILAKQREEITLLVKELHERDKELNEMVASHKQQLQAWEQDRQLVLHLQQKCVCLQGNSLT